MVRQTSAYLLILVVVSCPLLGLSEASADLPEHSLPVHRPWSSSVQPAEQGPDDSGDRGELENCLCGGAIVDTVLERVTVHDELAVPGGSALIVNVDGATSNGGATSVWTALLAASRPVSGRRLLALIVCLQL